MTDSETSGLSALFSPRSIAVIGASASEQKAGYAMMQSLSSFPGELYPINPRGGSILGHTAYASVSQLPTGVDLAVLVVPPTAVTAAIEECAAAGIRAAVICAGGFAESGEEGAAIQRELTAAAQRGGIRLLGPNTSGFINPVDNVCANFMPSVTELVPGGVAIVAQSGGVNLALSFMLAEAEIGLRLGMGLGNAVDVGFTDVLDFLTHDEATTAIGLHIEGIGDGREVMTAVRRAARRKPVVAFKVGKSDVGDFARSHTGALTGSYRLTRQALAQAGAVIVDDPTQLVDALSALSLVRLPPLKNPGVGIVTGQAGPGLVIADALAGHRVTVPTLSAETTHTLSTLLPPLTYQQNPVDTGRPAETFPRVLGAVAHDPAIDLVAVYALDEPGTLDPTAAVSGIGIPVLFASGGPRQTMSERRAQLANVDVPLFTSPDQLARGIAAVVAESQARHGLLAADEAAAIEGKNGASTPNSHDSGSLTLGHTLNENEAKNLIDSLGLTTPARRVAGTASEASAALAELGAPVVVKVLDAAITHKSDVGGVHVGIRTEAELGLALAAIDRIPGAASDGQPRRYLIEKQAEKGIELIVGGIRDDAFGPVVLLGLGGVDVELGGEPILRVAPIGEAEALSAVDELPASLLAGHRGAAAVDRAALARILVAVSTLIAEHGDIAEIDLNPVRVTASDTLVLDALIVTDPLENHVN
jgi:acyl-CoA synthetase (NDP forming)